MQKQNKSIPFWNNPPEDINATKELILGGEWLLAKAVLPSKTKFLNAFGMAIAQWLLPLVNQLGQQVKSIQRHTLVQVANKIELIIMQEIRIYLEVWQTGTVEYAEIALPCQVNGIKYEKYMFEINNTNNSIEEEFYNSFMGCKKDKKTMAEVWLDVFNTQMKKPAI